MFVLLLLCSALQTGIESTGRAADPEKPATYDELLSRDDEAWRELFQNQEFKQLDDIADAFRSERTKYPNGRGKLWRLAWCPFPSRPGEMSDEQ